MPKTLECPQSYSVERQEFSWLCSEKFPTAKRKKAKETIIKHIQAYTFENYALLLENWFKIKVRDSLFIYLSGVLLLFL